MSLFEDYIQQELPRRPALLTSADGWTGDPNDGGAPSIFALAPPGTLYLQGSAGGILWRKQTSSTGSWVGNVFSSPNGSRVYIYARTTGNDTTGTGTLANPYRTFVRAMKDVPAIIAPDTRYFIDLTGLGTENLSSVYSFPQLSTYSAKIVQNLTPADPVLTAEGALNVFALPTHLLDIPAATNSADPTSTQLTYTVSGAAWTVNQWEGKFFIGSGLGQIAVIASNTADTLEVTTRTAFTAPFYIGGLSAELRCTDAAAFQTLVVAPANAPTVLTGLRVSCANTSANDVSVDMASNVMLNMCDLDGSISRPGTGYAYYWSCYFRTGKYFSFTGATPDVRYCYGKSLTAWGFFYTQQNFPIYQCIFDTCGPIGPTGAGTSAAYKNCPMDIQYCKIRNGTSHGVMLAAGRNYLSSVLLSGNAGSGVYCAGPLTASLVKVQGTGNTSYGVHAVDGAHVQVDATTTATGTAGDLKSGTLAVRAWTDFRANPPLKSQVDLTAGTGDLSRVWQA